MSTNNLSDKNEVRCISYPEEIAAEILEKLKCPHYDGYLVAQFNDDNIRYKDIHLTGKVI